MTKIRAVRIVIKDILIFFMIIAVMAVIVTTACVVSVENAPIKKAKAYSFETLEEFAARSLLTKNKLQRQLQKIKKQEEKKKMLKHKIPSYHSTMCRMVTGQEKTKEEKEAELRLKKIRKRKAEEKRKYKINLELMAHLINGEAGDQSDECQQAVGMVILIRIKDKDFLCTTIKEAIFAPRQYGCLDDGNFNKIPTKQAYRNAKAVLTGNTIINVPKNVVYQAQFLQGSGLWRKIGTEYFCYK